MFDSRVIAARDRYLSSKAVIVGNAITTDRRFLWLFVRNDGGWWNVPQIAHHWRPTFADYEIEDHMRALVAAGLLTKRFQLGREQFAFTTDCVQLPGVEVAT